MTPSFSNHLEHVAEFSFLGLKVVLGSLGWRDLDWNTFSHLDAGRLQRFEFSRIIRHQTNAVYSEVVQHLSAKLIVPVIGLEPQMVIRLDRVVAGVLKLVCLQFVHQTNAAAFLKLVNKYAGSALRNRFQREVQLVAAIASQGTKHIAGKALRMDTDEQRLILSRSLGSTHDERQHTVGLVFGFETEDSERTEIGGKAGFRDLGGFHRREVYHGATGWLLSSTISSAVPRLPSGPGDTSLKAVPPLTW